MIFQNPVKEKTLENHIEAVNIERTSKKTKVGYEEKQKKIAFLAKPEQELESFRVCQWSLIQPHAGECHWEDFQVTCSHHQRSETRFPRQYHQWCPSLFVVSCFESQHKTQNRTTLNKWNTTQHELGYKTTTQRKKESVCSVFRWFWLQRKKERRFVESEKKNVWGPGSRGKVPWNKKHVAVTAGRKGSLWMWLNHKSIFVCGLVNCKQNR